ncbi:MULTISPECIES: hypothetical protein [Microvirgula]|uniref:Uncharacterized protein n=1 Tax=Microvirgula aerodenitrificans TaxID=57480 RepID=A0A2S0PDE1_9NEIS|nr:MULTISPECIES: hypothetical protein [Microvirgula]AVY95404.1 hypothetical protein DAI18_16155 [Microvirgula aerodenitrificans]
MTTVFPLNRNHLAFIASTVLLSTVMVIWVDLFTFSKVFHIPEWAKTLSAPEKIPAYLAFACLVPAAFLTDNISRACQVVAKTVLLSPLPAISVYAFNLKSQDFSLLFNTIFSYVWIVLFHCFIPATILLVARFAIQRLLNNIREQP